MLRYFKINIICILFLAFSFPASSELYQYKDENGIMRITDNIYSVPVGQRAQLEQFDEFEGLSNEIEILPIPSKPAPQTENQTQVKKDITPKTSKKITTETKKNIIPPDVVKDTAAESKEKTVEPVQPIYSEKPIEEPDNQASHRELYKSEKVAIRRIDTKAPSRKPALIKKPEKSIKKKAEPHKTLKADPESKIASKDQSQITIAKKPLLIPESNTESEKITLAKEIADAEKTTTASKTTQLKPEKSVQKSAGTNASKPDIIKPEAIKVGTITETPPKSPKKALPIPGKQAEIKSAQNTGSSSVVKKEINVENIINDKKTADSQQPAIEPTENIEQRTLQPDLKKKEKPDTKGVTLAETEIHRSVTPGKKTEIESAQKTDSQVVVKKEINAEKIINDEKISGSHQSDIEPNENIKQSNTRPKLINKPVPESKIIKMKPAEKITDKKPEPILNSETEKVSLPKIKTTDQKKGPAALVDISVAPKDTEKTIQPDIKTKTIPEIMKTDSDKPDYARAKKNAETLSTVNKTDLNKLAETIKTEPDTRQITSKESELIKNPAQNTQNDTIAAKRQRIETDNSKVTQKDESIVLAKLESTRKTLSNKKEALNKKFMALMKEKQEIEDSVDEDDEKSVLQYNENVKKLNLKIKQYKTEKKFLQAEIEKYNHAIKQSALN